MTRRAALALVRPPVLRPSFRPRLALPSPPRPGRRALLAAALAAALGLAGYAIARESSLFAVGRLELAGAPPAAAADAREALDPLLGSSLAALDPGEVERLLARVPTIRAASVDRAFPHTLRVHLVPERPAAVYRDGPRAWLLAESGRVVAEVKPLARGRLPRVRVPGRLRPTVGGTVSGAPLAALAILAAVPERFPLRVLFARVDEAGAAALVVEGWLEVRLGDGRELGRKLRSAAAVLRGLPPEERALLAHIDASVPERVVAAPNYQPESES